jgi:hypothetical protein
MKRHIYLVGLGPCKRSQHTKKLAITVLTEEPNHGTLAPSITRYRLEKLFQTFYHFLKNSFEKIEFQNTILYLLKPMQAYLQKYY